MSQVRSNQTHSLFEEPYWLNAVAPGRWGVVEEHRGGQVIGRLPYVSQTTRHGLSALRSPPLTPWLGTWVAMTEGSSSKRLEHEHKVVGALLSKLPSVHNVTLACAPETSNMMAFHWAGYRLGLRYTHRLDLQAQPDRLWADLTGRRRRSIRKARRSLTVRDDLGLAQFWSLYQMTFERQGMSMPVSRGVVERIEATMSARQQRDILFAVDGQGQVYASIYVVWDDRATFYLMGGRNHHLQDMGSVSLLMWEAIERAAGRSLIFDFEGSMIENIEQFFRSFGATQVPFYTAQKRHPLTQVNESLRALRRWGLAEMRASVLVNMPSKLKGWDNPDR